MEPPIASADPEMLADWLELKALASADRNSSLYDLARVLRRSGSVDALAELSDESDFDADRGGQLTSQIAEDAFADIEERSSACRDMEDRDDYPFELGDRHIQLKNGAEASVYIFLLLLSALGKDAGSAGPSGSQLFEDVCAAAIRGYLGGASTAHVKSRVFGFPRRLMPTGFVAALNQLCADMGEGDGARNHPRTRDQKDAKLDIVAWRDFADSKMGKLIAFGQCATGKNWEEKITELQPQNFCQLWLKTQPARTPIRLFFVPHRIDKKRWEHTAVYGGILFERCRIAGLAGRVLDDHVSNNCAAWSKRALASMTLP